MTDGDGSGDWDAALPGKKKNEHKRKNIKADCRVFKLYIAPPC
uniref:Uncharacterized protein n=1 Tax=uncultured bacterium contig00027 TaxID=1181516 RepID=A0A806K101_9BACT|nr:hypothetical protein [uncultured bacterium contig00027]